MTQNVPGLAITSGTWRPKNPPQNQTRGLPPLALRLTAAVVISTAKLPAMGAGLRHQIIRRSANSGCLGVRLRGPGRTEKR
jgi:hypothetical protein